MDLSSDEARVPLFMNKIIAKVTRISWESSNLRQPAQVQSQPVRPEPISQPVSQPIQQASNQPKQTNSASLNIFDESSSRNNSRPGNNTFDLLFPS